MDKLIVITFILSIFGIIFNFNYSLLMIIVIFEIFWLGIILNFLNLWILNQLISYLIMLIFIITFSAAESALVILFVILAINK